MLKSVLTGCACALWLNAAQAVPGQVQRTHAFTVKLPLAAAMPLFEPEGEKRWAPDWQPHYLTPADGRTQTGMVFTTGSGAELTIWTLAHYDPAHGAIRYVRTTPASRTAIIDIAARALDAQTTQVQVTYAFTALTDDGRAYLANLSEDAYARMIDGWSEAIAGTLGKEKRDEHE